MADVPHGWTVRQLEEITDVRLSSVNKKEKDGEPAVRLCNYMDVYTHSTISEAIDFMWATARPTHIERLALKRGDVIITKDSEDPSDIGVPSVVVADFDQPVVCGYHLALLRPNGAVRGDYLAWALRSRHLRNQFERTAHGTTRFGLTSSAIKNAEAFVPPAWEQQKIAAILSSVDNAIAATRNAINQTKRVKTGLLKTLMTRGIGHTRFKPVPENWVTGKPPGLKEVPFEWEVVRLTDVARLESGHTPARGNDDYWGGDVPWVSLHDTDRLVRRVIDDTGMNVTEAGLANSSARLLPEGTVVFSRTATIGRCSLLGRPMATSQDFANYVCGPRVHNRFLCHLFRSMGPVWKSLRAGSTHQTIYMPDFEKLRIALPPIHEQVEIAARIDAMDDVLENWPRYRDSMEQLKEGLMQDLLTGRVRAQPD